ncbi:MAG: glycosyltransferase family 4 protein [Candidatus Hydrogenedentota bacterium]
MNIGYFIESSCIAGAQKSLYLLLKYTDKKYNNYVFCPDDGPYFEKFASVSKKVITLNLNKRFDIKEIYRIRNLIKEYNLDIINCQTPKIGIWARLATFFLLDKPYIIMTIHGFGFRAYLERTKTGFYDRTRKRILFILERFLDLFTDYFIFVSKNDYEKSIKNSFYPTPKMRYIPNGIELIDPLTITIPKEIKKNNKDIFRVGYIGRFSIQKSVSVLVKACIELLKENYNIECILVGDGEEKEKIISLIEGSGYKNKFIFTGEVFDVMPYIKTFDTLVLPSLWEGLPHILIEAGLLGIPAIASDVDGNKEIIIDGYNGFLFPSNDINSLKSRLKILIDNPNKLYEFSINIKDTITKYFDITKVINSYETFYNTLF